MEVNRIYCGNCIDLIDELDLKPNLIIMSPPDLENNFTIEEYRDFINIIYNKCMDKLDDNGVIFSCSTDRKKNGIYLKHLDIINSISSKSILFNTKIWVKSFKTNLYILNFAYLLFFKKKKAKITNNKIKEFYPDAWHIELDKVKNYSNKDSFPTELVKRVILNFTNENDLVLDPFIGSGKTAKVAKDLNRNYIGFEINPKNIEIANKMLE